jgi:hypothetical protein
MFHERFDFLKPGYPAEPGSPFFRNLGERLVREDFEAKAAERK